MHASFNAGRAVQASPSGDVYKVNQASVDGSSGGAGNISGIRKNIRADSASRNMSKDRSTILPPIGKPTPLTKATDKFQVGSSSKTNPRNSKVLDAVQYSNRRQSQNSELKGGP